MISSAAEAGLSLDEFWRSTPRMLAWALEGYERRRAWAAWHAGYPANVKQPKWDDLIRPRRKRAMDADTMLKNVRALKKRLQEKFGAEF